MKLPSKEPHSNKKNNRVLGRDLDVLFQQRLCMEAEGGKDMCQIQIHFRLHWQRPLFSTNSLGRKDALTQRPSFSFSWRWPMVSCSQLRPPAQDVGLLVGIRPRAPRCTRRNKDRTQAMGGAHFLIPGGGKQLGYQTPYISSLRGHHGE